jgi:NADH-quinone oxidoreductase subunit J
VVYVGAVMVLFLFVVMMLDVEHAEHKEGFVRYWPFAVLLTLVLAVLFINFLGHISLAQPTHTWNLTDSNLQQVGLNLFNQQLYPFELAALILLAAMIAAIALTFRGRRKDDKAQVVSRQIKVSAKDRLKLMDVDNKGI